MGHYKGSKACKAKLAEDRAKTRMERVNQLDRSEDSDRDNIRRVSKDINGAVGSTPKTRTVDVLLTALNNGLRIPNDLSIEAQGRGQETGFRKSSERQGRVTRQKKVQHPFVTPAPDQVMELMEEWHAHEGR